MACFFVYMHDLHNVKVKLQRIPQDYPIVLYLLEAD